ncbi:MAG: DUF1343 domain-containing protein [Balneolaceae bacterium]|nr:MAG: DUF1343 domain-containing protein [Balneolaceae bacterium]
MTSLIRIFIFLFYWIPQLSACSGPAEINPERTEVRTGAEVLLERYLDEMEGLRVGLVMNPTARIGSTHLLDTLLAEGVNITALFAPEHGFRGEAGAGEIIEDGVDQASGLPVFSLYGSTRKPTGEMLKYVDLLIFDMQDVGARFYTYIATLGLVLEAAAEHRVPVWILDRPNPAGGDFVSGWILEEEFISFVGPFPIPIAHGLTMGELAAMMTGERWIEFENPPVIRVVEMEGWRREMKWPDTGLNWVPPSPNLPAFEHAFVYLGTVFYEGTSLSEGRGTTDPFLTIGDPGTRLTPDQLERLKAVSESLRIDEISFTPVSIPGVAPAPKHENRLSNGIRISVSDFGFDPVKAGLEIFTLMLDATDEYELRNFLYLLAGTREIDRLISGELSAKDLDFQLEPFLESRSHYLLYP